MEKKYEDAILALSEMLLDKARDAKYQSYLIEDLRAKIVELEKELKRGE